MLDNFDSIQNLMQNNKDCFYVISIIQRAKDFEDGFGDRKHKEHFIRHYFVKDAKELLDIKQNIVDICKIHNARAYFVGRIRKEDGNIDVQKLGNTLADFRTKNDIKDNELELKKNSMIVLYK